jgi:hypothetical protein
MAMCAGFAFADSPVNPFPDETPVTDVPEDAPQRTGKLWVCCDAAGQRWTATKEVCEQRSGQILPSRYCERPTSKRRVCCKQGRAEWIMPSARACHEDGGIVADMSYCR